MMPTHPSLTLFATYNGTVHILSYNKMLKGGDERIFTNARAALHSVICLLYVEKGVEERKM
jgi:hypothetical protein